MVLIKVCKLICFVKTKNQNGNVKEDQILGSQNFAFLIEKDPNREHCKIR